MTTFDTIYMDNGDAEAYGLAKLLCTYKLVACLYMLCDILCTIAILQGSLQAKKLDLASVPAMVDACTGRLKKLKAKPTTSTWFKDHLKVFSDENQLGGQNVTITEAEKECFTSDIYQPHVQSVIYHISSRMQ